jgi:hypothetical protein
VPRNRHEELSNNAAYRSPPLVLELRLVTRSNRRETHFDIALRTRTFTGAMPLTSRTPCHHRSNATATADSPCVVCRSMVRKARHMHDTMNVALAPIDYRVVLVRAADCTFCVGRYDPSLIFFRKDHQMQGISYQELPETNKQSNKQQHSMSTISTNNRTTDRFPYVFVWCRHTSHVVESFVLAHYAEQTNRLSVSIQIGVSLGANISAQRFCITR